MASNSIFAGFDNLLALVRHHSCFDLLLSISPHPPSLQACRVKAACACRLLHLLASLSISNTSAEDPQLHSYCKLPRSALLEHAQTYRSRCCTCFPTGVGQDSVKLSKALREMCRASAASVDEKSAKRRCSGADIVAPLFSPDKATARGPKGRLRKRACCWRSVRLAYG